MRTVLAWWRQLRRRRRLRNAVAEERQRAMARIHTNQRGTWS